MEVTPRTRIPDAHWARASWIPDPWGWVFAASVLLLLARAMLMAEPVLMYDEYHLAKTAQLWFLNAEHARTITGIPGAGEPNFPNSLFFGLYQFTFAFGTSFYTAAKILNVLLVAGSAYAAGRVAMMFTDRRTAGWIAVLVLWLPATGYASGFLAEPLYECIVWVGLWTFFSLLERDVRRAAAALGACLAAAYLTKPTAVVLLVTANAVIALAATRADARGSRFERVMSSVAALDLTFLATGFVLNAVLTRTFVWDPIGNYYRQDLARALSVETGGQFLAAAMRYVLAYTFFVLLLFGPAVTAVLAGFGRVGRTVRLAALWWFAVAGMTLLVLGTAKASMNWEQVYQGAPRIYSTRYMSVLFPLLLIAYAGLRDEAVGAVRIRRVVGSLIALLVAGLAIAFANIDNTIQLREIFWTRGWTGIGGKQGISVFVLAVCAFAACSAYHAMARKPRAAVYGGLLSVWAVASAMGLFRLDWWTSNGWYGPSDRAGRVVASLVSPSARDEGLVVFDYNWRASSFMFRYPGFVPLRQLPSGTVVERSTIPASAKWVVFLGPILPAVRDPQCVGLPDVLWCPLSREALVQPDTGPERRE